MLRSWCRFVRATPRRCCFSLPSSKAMATAPQPAAPPSLADDRTARPPFSPELKYSGNLFRYSEGRFMYDDAYQLLQRCVHELARIAAETVRASACVKIERYPDGMYIQQDDATHHGQWRRSGSQNSAPKCWSSSLHHGERSCDNGFRAFCPTRRAMPG